MFCQQLRLSRGIRDVYYFLRNLEFYSNYVHFWTNFCNFFSKVSKNHLVNISTCLLNFHFRSFSLFCAQMLFKNDACALIVLRLHEPSKRNLMGFKTFASRNFARFEFFLVAQSPSSSNDTSLRLFNEANSNNFL